MKFWNRLGMGTLAVLLALSLGLGQSLAAGKKETKKKKEEKKKEETHHVARMEYRGAMMPIAGTNLSGKPGYFFSDTAEPLAKGQWMGAGHLTFDTWGNQFEIPVGVSYGITDKLLVNV
ncbi:MAG TPA: hypothetical protein VFR02_06605, partial [bacterium]|nr:hypothetical protein [bacterium]